LYDDSGANVLKTGFTPAYFTINSCQQYRIGMGNYGAYYFDRWQDDASKTNPQSISISTNTVETAVYTSVP
jgi:hypothetical protein